ncbi:MAG: hypothetical protein ACREMJ_03385 [Gemmatimonadales bacterium]
MSRPARAAYPWAAAIALWAAPLAGQATLADAAREARAGWLAHDAEAVVGEGSRVVLQIPGADPSAAVSRAQAMALLARYLRPAVERAMEIVTIREVEDGRGFVEFDRRYVIAGTADVRRETLFLGFRRVGGRWVLVELRRAP